MCSILCLTLVAIDRPIHKVLIGGHINPPEVDIQGAADPGAASFASL